MSSQQSYIARWQDPTRYDGEDLDSPREYHQAVVFHTSQGPRLASHFLPLSIAPLEPFNPDDSDVAMTEAPAAGPHSIAGPAFADTSDITMMDFSPAGLSRSTTAATSRLLSTSSRLNSNTVHWTPPQGYQPPNQLRRSFKHLASAIRKRSAQLPEEHYQRLQWQNILSVARQPLPADASSPSDHFRSVTTANTLANRPRNHPHDLRNVDDIPVTPQHGHIATAGQTPPAARQLPPSLPQQQLFPQRQAAPARSSQPTAPKQPQLLAPTQSSAPVQHHPFTVTERQRLSPPRRDHLAPSQQQQQQRQFAASSPLPQRLQRPPSQPRSSSSGNFNSSSSTLVAPSSSPRERSMDEMLDEEALVPSRDRQHRTASNSSHQLSHAEMPVRRVGGMIATLSSWFYSVWQSFFGRGQYREERIAVENNQNRHKRRAVSPQPETALLTENVKEAERPVSHSESQRQDVAKHVQENLRRSAETEREIMPVKKTRPVKTQVYRSPIVRDGKTQREIMADLTEEAKRRGVAILPSHPSRQRRPGKSLRSSTQRPHSSNVQGKHFSPRDRRVNTLTEISSNIIKARRVGHPVKRGQKVTKEKLRRDAELAQAIAAKEIAKREAADEDARWAAQLRAEETADALAAAEAAEKAEAEALAAARPPPLIQPLTHEQQDLLAKTLASSTNHAEITTGLDGSPLYRSDFDRILSTANSTAAWLNDNAVNAFYAAIVERSKTQSHWTKTSNEAPPFAAMNSQWLSKVQSSSNSIQSIARWSRRLNISKQKLLTAHHIFFPINSSAHWSLLVISPREKTIEYLDSLSTSHATAAKFFAYARAWLAMELNEKDPDVFRLNNARGWTEVYGRSQSQANCNDCGVFACFNGFAIAKKRDFKDVNARVMNDARLQLASVLINQGFDDDEEFAI